MASKDTEYREAGDNGARGRPHEYRPPEGREGAERTAGEGTPERGRRAPDERGRFYDAARERLRSDDRPEQGAYYATPGGYRDLRETDLREPDEVRHPRFDRDRTLRDRDRGYETTSIRGEQFEPAREGFRDFGTPTSGQGREVRDPYNTRNWDEGFEGRDDRVAGRSGHAYFPEAREPVHPREQYEPRRAEPRFARRHEEWEEEPLIAREVMTPSPRFVHSEAPLREVARIMKDENCGVVPVVDRQERLIGVITDRDMVLRTFENDRAWTDVHAVEVMTDDVEAVTPDEPVHAVVRLMGRKQIRRVPVVDRGDHLVGMISMTDIARRAESDRSLQDAMVKVARKRSFWSKLWT